MVGDEDRSVEQVPGVLLAKEGEVEGLLGQVEIALGYKYIIRRAINKLGLRILYNVFLLSLLVTAGGKALSYLLIGGIR